MDNPFYKAPSNLRPFIRYPDDTVCLSVPRPKVGLRSLALAVACSLQGAWAEQAAGAAPLTLKSSSQLQEGVSGRKRSSLPSFMRGDLVLGRPELETVIEGHAELRRGDLSIRADRLEYDQPTDLARARGNVHINRAGNIYDGTQLELKVDAFEGYFLNPGYRFLQNGGHGQGDRIDFLDEQRSVISNASYTTCKRTGPDWMPEWVLRASSIHFDIDADSAQAQGAVLQFQGLSILPLPGISFPLGDKRKSGWLAPLIEQDSVSGLSLTTPYYWNIAPQWDATFYPSVLSRRGLNLGSELRYLQSYAQGVIRADIMPTDSLRKNSRWGLSTVQSGNLNTGLASVGNLGFGLSLNRVSDDNYWRDFPRGAEALRQRLLPNDANLSWSREDWSASVRTLAWQSLQDVAAPIVPPYDRMPQLTLRHGRHIAGGFDYSLEADITQFRADPALTQQTNGVRGLATAQVSYPWQTPGWFVVPKAQWHTTHYRFDTALSDGSLSAARSLPTFSLDGGLLLERDARFFGRDFRQTLEPRALYVLTPYRDQSRLPNYDSAAQDFNFASIFSENAFLGNDRVSDSNLLTLALTSRLLDLDTGNEAVRLGVAQRLRFTDQNVTLPGGTPVKDRISDLMVGATLNWTPQWSLDSTVQFNPKTSRSQSIVMGGYFNPGPYRVLSAAYRLQRGLSEQLSLGWQWPLDFDSSGASMNTAGGQGLGPGKWYAVGRMNYSLAEKKLVDSVLGFEYDAGCWLGRVVVDRLQSSAVTATTRLALQFEFVGFTRTSIGADPLKLLKDNIPRYQYLREPTTTPSRFSQFD